MRRFILIVGFLVVGIGQGVGQINPPGLAGAKAVGWVAVGVTQDFSKRWSATTYVGTSTQSSLADYMFWQKPAISIVNQEVGYQLAKHWQIILAGSLRSQSLYQDAPPYESRDPAFRREIRTYSRLFFRHQAGKVSWMHSFRPEYRRFFTPDWHAWSSPLQLRLRLYSQLNYPLNEANTTQFIAANEVFMLVNRVRDPVSQALAWGPYRLSEDRLFTFVRRAIKKPALFIDGGLVHQFWWDDASRQIRYTTYLSLNFVFRNPIKKWAP